MTAEAVIACPAGQWCREASPAAADILLHAVWAVSADDVFAVGDRGTILRRTGGEWTAMSSGTTQNLRGVWAASSSDVWASGATGTVLHFTGGAWSAVPVPSSAGLANLDAVWGSSSTDVWFAGSGTVLHWDGAGFTPFGFGGTLLSVSGTGPADVWATGENTHLHRYDGATWATVMPVSGTSTFFTVLAISSDDVWVSDFLPGKETAHGIGVGGRWTTQGTGGAIFQDLSALSSNDVWGAGGSRIGRWNGTAWAIEQPLGTNVVLWSITTTPTGAWVVGSGGLIAHRSLP